MLLAYNHYEQGNVLNAIVRDQNVLNSTMGFRFKTFKCLKCNPAYVSAIKMS